MLTNKPRIGLLPGDGVRRETRGKIRVFCRRPAPGGVATGRSQNHFVDQVQSDYGKELLKLVIDQSAAAGRRDRISEQALKQFAEADQSEGGR